MKKDGPCAIRIKGTAPLWVSKTRFEKSPLMPLLTRKKHYTFSPRKNLVEKVLYDFTKSPCEQIPEFYIGEEAEKVLRQCEEEGIKTVCLTMEDIDAYTVLERNEKEPLEKRGNAATSEFWKQLRLNSKQALKEKTANTINFDAYDDKKIIVVQKLRNQGFTPRQIHALDALIQTDMGFDEIITFFGPAMDVDEIQMFSTRLAKIKEKIN